MPAGATSGSAPTWHRYILGPPSTQVSPVGAEGRGSVAGRTPASVVLDFGKDVAGMPYFEVTAVAGAPTLTLVTGSAFDPVAATVSLTPALSADVPVGTAVSTSPGAPASDESRGLAGVGGVDTLQPTAPGRLSGTFHGGFRFVLLTLTMPGSVSISAARVDFQALRATPADYKGWFLSSDDQVNPPPRGTGGTRARHEGHIQVGGVDRDLTTMKLVPHPAA
jgi:hypothetical protein